MTKQDILIVLPEIVIALMACFILVLDLYLPATKKQKFGYGLSMLTLAVGAALSLIYSETAPVYGLNGLVLMDSLSAILKAGICILTACVLVYGRSYANIRGLWKGEFFCANVIWGCRNDGDDGFKSSAVSLRGPGIASLVPVCDGGIADRLDSCVRSSHEIFCIGRTGFRDITVWHIAAVWAHRDAVYQRIVSIDGAL